MRRFRPGVIAALLMPVVFLLLSTGCGDDGYVIEYSPDYSEYAACLPPDDIPEDLEFTINYPEPDYGDSYDQYWGDLDEIRKRGVLRVLTRNNGTDYYIYRGRTLGFEYELARDFAEYLGVKLKMVAAPSRIDLIPWLHEGRGDIICAGFSVTAERREKVRFSYAYSQVTRVVLSNKKVGRAVKASDLTGMLFAMRENSIYFKDLENLAYDHGYDMVTGPDKEHVYEALLPDSPAIKILLVKPEMEDEDIADMVSSGQVDAMLMDSDMAALESSYKPKLLIGMEVSAPLDHSWAVRNENGELWLAANSFIKKKKDSGAIEKLQNKYFKKNNSVHSTKKKQTFKFVAQPGQISPFDDLFKNAGKKHGIDWRLLAALAYQESQFNPAARSPGGAVGVMQLMPETARHLGVKNPEKPADSINAGARYMRTLVDHFGTQAKQKDRILMALAAYNIGYGHIEDARKLAVKVGLDPNVWAGNVEKAAMMLKQHKYAREARFGYFRCDFTLKFVKSVQERFERYVAISKGKSAALVKN